ncbi:MAG: 4-oxalocrotonate tautomerase [Rhodospirillales bacterium]|nr:4-oxalocrotonate tautomerase [Rhodospirillales bacterium]
MPHVIVKLWPGKSDEQKRRLSDAIAQNVTTILNYGEDAVSVAVEEVSSTEWSTHVYEPDIVRKWANLTKEPGYGPSPNQLAKVTK